MLIFPKLRVPESIFKISIFYVTMTNDRRQEYFGRFPDLRKLWHFLLSPLANINFGNIA